MIKKNTYLIGIVNLTPDSFSDGGLLSNKQQTLKHVENLIAEGAKIIDVGAESTRPNAKPVTPAEEWSRLKDILPEIIELAKNKQVKISIDTRNPETAKNGIKVGVDWINDVSGCSNPNMIKLLQNSKVDIVIMHNLGVPVNPNHLMDKDINIIDVIFDWGANKIKELESYGIKKKRIIFDPGIGFGKHHEQSLSLIKNIGKFKALGVRILIGHSRKTFLSLFIDTKPQHRDLETYIMSIYLNLQNIDYLRVHDIKGNKRAINASQAIFS